MTLPPLFAAFDWPHAVTILVGLIAAIVALLPIRRRRGRTDAEPSEGRLANIETRLACVETSLQEHRHETRAGMRQILDHLLARK